MNSTDLKVAAESDSSLLLPLVRAYHEFEQIVMTDAERVKALSPLLAANSSLGRIWLIRFSGRAVGYIALCFGYSIEFRGRDAFVDEFFIAEEVRGRGIGSAALESIKQQAALMGLTALHLQVATSNEKAKRLYLNAGFRFRERFQSMTCIINGIAA